MPEHCLKGPGRISELERHTGLVTWSDAMKYRSRLWDTTRLWRAVLLLFVFVILLMTWFVLRQRRLEQEALSLLNKPFVEYKEVVRLLGPPAVTAQAGVAYPGTTLDAERLNALAQKSPTAP